MHSFEDFELGTEVGRGATARVFAARRKSDGSKVALKIFHPGFWDRHDFRRRAQSEFTTVSSLSHPGIVQVYEPLWTHDPPAVVMEYVEGKSLEEFQSRLPYVLPEVGALIVIEVLRALEYAHSRGIVHRDLKPANILIADDSRVRVSDFGLAKMKDMSQLTLSGTILGSPDYMSPEQARGDVTSARSDVFSAGSVLYFLVTGTRPFSRHTPLATLAAVSDASYEPAQQRNPKLSPGLARVLHRALSRKPEDRYPSAQAFHAALESYLLEVGLGPDQFSFEHWMADSAETTLSSLKSIARSLIHRIEARIASEDWDGALEGLSHLSQVAPESAALPRLMETLGAARQRARRKAMLWPLTAAAILLCLSGGAWWLLRAPQAAPVASAIAQAPAQPPPAPPALEARTQASAPARADRPRAPRGSRVSLDIPAGVGIFWNGRRVEPGKGLPPQMPGTYTLRLEKTGAPPIVQPVTVVAGEPTVIRVR